MHHTSKGIWAQIGAVEGEKTVWEASKIFGLTEAGTKVKKGQSLFPRIDVKKKKLKPLTLLVVKSKKLKIIRRKLKKRR